MYRKTTTATAKAAATPTKMRVEEDQFFQFVLLVAIFPTFCPRALRGRVQAPWTLFHDL